MKQGSDVPPDGGTWTAKQGSGDANQSLKDVSGTHLTRAGKAPRANGPRS